LFQIFTSPAKMNTMGRRRRRCSTLSAIVCLLAVALKTTTVASDDTSRAVRGGDKYQPQLHSQEDGSTGIVSSTSSLTRALPDDDEPTAKLLKLTISKPVVDVSNGESTTEIQIAAQGPALADGSFIIALGQVPYAKYYERHSFKFTRFSVGRCIGQRSSRRPLRGVIVAGMGCVSLAIQRIFRGIVGRNNEELAIGKATVTFPMYIPPGAYTIDELSLFNMGGRTLLHVERDGLTKLKVASTIKIRNSKVDLSPPAVVDFVATTPTTIDVSNGMQANVTFEVDLEDAMLGIRSLYLVARSNRRSVGRFLQLADNQSCDRRTLAPWNESAADGKASLPIIPSLCLGKRPTRAKVAVNLTFVPYMQPGNYSLELTTYDTGDNSNKGIVNATELRSRGLVHTIQLLNRNPDISPPTIVSLTALSTLATSFERVRFNLTATDDFSGWWGGNVTAVHKDSGQILTSNEEFDSCYGWGCEQGPVWSRRFSFGTPNRRKGVYKLSIYLEDLEFNNITIGSDELIAKGWPGNFTVL
jgi:hypothetical protein